MSKTSWKPTKKWYAALVGAITPILISGIESGFDDTEAKMAAAAVGALLLAYFKSNDTTQSADGVPV